MQFAIIGTVGVHAPQQGEDAACTNADERLQDKDERELTFIEPKEAYAEHCCHKHGCHKGVALAYSVAYWGGKYNANDVGSLPNGKIKTAKHEGQTKERDVAHGRFVDVILEIVDRCAIANGVEHKRSHTRTQQNPPRTIVQQVAQVGLERVFLLLHGFYALFREGETTKEKHHAHYGNNHHGHKPTKLWSGEPATH